MARDALGRITEAFTGQGAEALRTTFGYDADGHLAVTTDTLGRETVVLERDAVGRATRIGLPAADG